MTHLDLGYVQALGWTLLHFVWQGAALAALFASLNWALRQAAPSVRYVLAAATLFAMLALPAGTFGILTRHAGPEAAAPLVRPEAPIPAAPVIPLLAPAAASEAMRQSVEGFLPALVGLWGVGVLVLSLRTLGGWALVQRLKRSGLTEIPSALEPTLQRLKETLRVKAPVRLCQSALVQVPTALGWLRPMILMPAGALVGLSATQLELVLAHELAHIRRRDYLVNLLQTAVETLLFYHPAVWWVSGRMRIEREHCCDDLAVAACGNAVGYARALADLEGLSSRGPVLAMAASGGSLFERVARLVAPPSHLSQGSRGLATLLVAGALSLAFALGAALVGAPKAAVEAAPQVPENSPSVPNDANPEEPTTVAGKSGDSRAFPLERILELARAGVTPEYIDAMDAIGFDTLTADQLVALRTQGVDPEYVAALAEAGYKDLKPEQLVQLRSQGVDPDEIRCLMEHGLEHLSLSDLLMLRAQGVTADFVAEMKEAGYADLSVAKLIALRSQGVDGEYAAALKDLGYPNLSTSKLIALRSQGVDPDYVRELNELGYRGLSLPLLLALRNHGVGTDFVRELNELGYTKLPAGALVELRAAGVTPDFIREMKDAGFDNLKTDELVRLRHSGVSGELAKRLKGRL